MAAQNTKPDTSKKEKQSKNLTDAHKRKAANKVAALFDDRNALKEEIQNALKNWKKENWAKNSNDKNNEYYQAKKLWFPESVLSDLFSSHEVSPVEQVEFQRILILNKVYGTSLYADDMIPMAEFLSIRASTLNQLIHSSCNNDTFAAVNTITKAIKQSRKKFCYSFATKYCSFLAPEKYYIYDSYLGFLYKSKKVKEILRDKVSPDAFKFIGPWTGAKSDCQRYRHFCEVAEGVRIYLNEIIEQELSIKELDQALWQIMKMESEECRKAKK